MLLSKAVADHPFVAFADAAVVAIIFADIGDFNQPSNKDPVAKLPLSGLTSDGIELFFLLPQLSR